jgi:F0F1-type ATP synthase delta subunit
MKLTVQQIARAVVDTARIQPAENYEALADAVTEIMSKSGLLRDGRRFIALVDKLWQKQEGVTSVKVLTSGGDLSVLKKQLLAVLEPALGRRCILEEKTDPKIIGGLLLSVGDERFDCTVRTALNELADRMAAPVTLKS